MTAEEVKKTLEAYAGLENRAAEILKAGGVKFGGINRVELANPNAVEISYWTTGCGEPFDESEYVPVEMFADGADLAAGWDEIRRRQRESEERVRAETAKAEAEKERARELAELKRLKEKYPDAP